MSKYLILLALIIPTQIYADKVDNYLLRSAVYKQIKRVRPGIDSQYALKLTKSIYEVSRAFKIDASLLTAIIAQESMFKTEAINLKSRDYGLAQINHKTAKAYNFDTNRLKTDPKYAIWAAGIVLNDFHKLKEKNYWSRYNSSKPEKRQIYEQLVARYL